MHRWITGAVLALSACATAAAAGAPQPVKPAPAAMYTGRWYQIARIAAADPHPCHAATDDFIPAKGGGFAVTVACRDNSGKLKRMTVMGDIEPGPGGAKLRIAFLGGLFHQEYWVLDHAADDACALMATPGGHYLWLLSRTPALAVGERARVELAVKALGYAGRLAPDP
ncbi:MAG TPA: lipocalin family protein [Caulobacteraceae bacterium]|jgi:apolipoprotein D and lipocalin family protein